ncbi:DUF2075 domain-containing protein [Clostridium botulinum]|uniref:DUF2075 domain-containing protein n=1 Tax=Clostridium botulinum TaxID=1491 RepID=UPI0019673B36|nr:DUF2075 domain-containing protein [Clostridium botulinum]MBN1060202.1 DUF2075 domain-containing protein [Clostridium botulinum]
MKLYSGTAEQFILDNNKNHIAEKLRLSFFYKFRYEPSEYEILFWENSLKELSKIFNNIGLKDNGVLLEYKLPLTSKRLNCVVTGKSKENKEEAIIIELKEWDKCHRSSGKNEVTTYVGGAKKEILHPCVQVGQYIKYLNSAHTAFNDNCISLNGCTYLHNYNFETEDPILDEKFKKVANSYPMFSKDDAKSLEKYIDKNVGNGNGLSILEKVEEGKYKPNKKLMNHVSNVIKGIPEYILLDEQQVVYDKVFSITQEAYRDTKKKVVIIKGGPGTGKSVIAINLMSDLLKEGYNTHYATGSRAFTETLRSTIGIKSSSTFKYFNSYMQEKENTLDVLICDEAHRIRRTSNNRFTKKDMKSDLAQIDELLKVAKVCVFFIDDMQVVRPDEVGTTNYIKEKVKENGYELFEYELKIQFRCNGSEGFVNWIDNTLGIKPTANIIFDSSQNEFDFKIVKSPFELEEMIKEKSEEGYSSRIVAGFCWPWSKKPDEEGNLINDIVIGDFKRPWNAHPDIRNIKSDIPKAPKWAHDKNGINQIGCIYTAQGFEFDYVGVIIGKDLTYDLDESKWVSNKEYCEDTIVKRSKDKLTQLLKNTYRVLLSRGMKGCYVYFEDKDTERFFSSRM